jgi:hypothetical protein
MVTYNAVQRDTKLISGLQQGETNAVESTLPPSVAFAFTCRFVIETSLNVLIDSAMKYRLQLISSNIDKSIKVDKNRILVPTKIVSSC